MGFLGTDFQQSVVETAQERLYERPKTPQRQKTDKSSMLWIILSNFMLRMAIFDHELGIKKLWGLFVAFVSATLNPRASSE
jgi:hypothetical protein